MKAVGISIPGPVDSPDALVDLDLPVPAPGPHDLLVRVKAISVNPADTKVRRFSSHAPGTHRIAGYDAAGVVEAVGAAVTLFRPGDAVYYAGDITRPGTNAELHLVDERIVAAKPTTLEWAGAAALPLTAITAWEALFDRIDVTRPVPGANALLVIGGAGGVGSIAIQLAKVLTDLPIIATASRPATVEWAQRLGADHVIDHRQPLAPQVAALGIGAPGFVLSTTYTEQHLPAIAELIAPQGRLALIDDPKVLDIAAFKHKMVSVHWEFMFGRAMFQTPDMVAQHKLLSEVARLVDQGRIITTQTQALSPINAATLREAHALIESERMRGKIVLEGWA
jgi:NADPH2:quinone reductase